MKSRWQNRARVLLLALACVALLGGQAAAQEKPVHGGTLNVGLVNDMKTLDPVFSVQFTERQPLYLIFNTLVKLSPDFSIEPELARSWDVKDGGKTIVFHLQEGVRFHDGTAFDASVVKWNLDHRMDKAVKSPQGKGLSSIIESVDVVNKNTVAFKLVEPAPGLMGMLGQREGFMVSPAAVEKWGADFGSHPVGTGAFTFVEWVRGSHLTVVRNPDYWEKGLPYLDKVVFNDIPNSVVGEQRLATKEVDLVDTIAAKNVLEVQKMSNIKLYPIKVGRWYSLHWHWSDPPFNNPALREAIAYAVDRKKMVEILLGGNGTVSDTPTPPGLWWFDPNIKIPDHDPAMAKKKLAEAGYPNGLDLTLTMPSIPIYEQLCELVQEELGAVGIRVKLEPADAGNFYAQVYKGQINFVPVRWTQRPDPDGLFYILFHKGGPANTSRYDNPAADALLDKARLITDRKERQALYWQYQKILAHDLPVLPLFFSTENAAARDVVHGFVWIPDQIPRYREVWKSGP
jgi:peptide/nickel transport system substrate-binding protein